LRRAATAVDTGARPSRRSISSTCAVARRRSVSCAFAERSRVAEPQRPESVAGALLLGEPLRLGGQLGDVDRRARLDDRQALELALRLGEIATYLGALRERAVALLVETCDALGAFDQLHELRALLLRGQRQERERIEEAARHELVEHRLRRLHRAELVAHLERALAVGRDGAANRQTAVELDDDLGRVGAMTNRVGRLRTLAAERSGEGIERAALAVAVLATDEDEIAIGARRDADVFDALEIADLNRGDLHVVLLGAAWCLASVTSRLPSTGETSGRRGCRRCWVTTSWVTSFCSCLSTDSHRRFAPGGCRGVAGR
jgi:hypothetical protein